MNVRSILKEWLTDNGYDGLYSPGECGCLLDDLAPCGDIDALCRAGYKLPGDEDYDLKVGPKKERKRGSG